MRITIIGSGYVGLVTGACLADAGNHVLCMDNDAAKVELLRGGGIPIYEPGLEQLVRDNSAAGRLAFTGDLKKSAAHGEVLFIAVPTPPDEDGAADVSHVLAAARAIAACMAEEKLVVNKSTAPVGTVHRAREVMAEELGRRGKEIKFSVVSNPEFLKEGAAVEDFMKPDRIIIGVDGGGEGGGGKARQVLEQLYAPFNRSRRRMLVMDVRSAELTKYAANAMLATKISFINEMAALAEILGADIEHVRQGIGADRRIGHHCIYPGCGYGGSCLPKDVQALRRTAAGHGYEARILAAVSDVNRAQKTLLAKKIAAHFNVDDGGRGEGWKKLRFALWGLAFKPNTDDVREAPAIALARHLLARGAQVQAHDPAANANAKKILGDGLRFYDDPYAALSGCDALLVLTEWKVFHNPDLKRMASLMRGRAVFDGRNMYRPAMFSAAGFTCHGIGRPA